jgi:hypothetical protein
LFGYEDRIIIRLTELGAKVFYIDQRVDNKAVTKIIIRLFPFFLSFKTILYFHKKLKKIKEIDKILVISPECLSLKLLKHIKKITDAKESILYMWDSFNNKKNAKKVIPFFNKILTFDREDANRMNIYFRPLFYCSSKKYIDKNDRHIDISFIGTGHSDRAKIISLINEQCQKKNMFFYLYLQHPLVYYYNKVTNPNFRGIKKNKFHFSPFNYVEFEQIIESSKAVVDIEHPAQKGLTMRTFEILGKETKLITTNKTIKEYDFYNDKNILIIDRENPVINTEFIENNYQTLSKELYYKYSIDGWLEDIFFKNYQEVI